jgi:heme-binding NEAT domain protein
MDNAVFNEYTYPVSYDLSPATILSEYDVVDDFNKEGGSDHNVAGKMYPEEITIPVTIGQEYTWVHVYVPVMGSLDSGDQVARIKLDWSGLINSSSANKAALDAKIAEMSAVTQGGYTTESWNVFTAALTAAQTVSEDAGATAADVSDALSALNAAYNGLTSGGGGGTGDNGNPDGIGNGNYTIAAEARQENSDSLSMANQFIKEPLKLTVSGSSMTAEMVWNGTETSPESPVGIHMRLIEELKYKNASGTFVDVSKTLNDAQNTLTVTFPVETVSEPVYFQVYVPQGMGETRQVFKLVFNKSTLTAVSGGSTPSPSPGTTNPGNTSPGGGGGVTSTPNSVSAPPAAPAAVTFADAKGHWAESVIEYVVSKGLFNGTDAGVFSPDLQMTRGMFVTILGRAAKIDGEKYTAAVFNDVEQSMYYAPHVAWAAENGLVNGVGGNSFAPEDDVTREQMAVILYNYARFAGISLEAEKADGGAEAYSIQASALKENDDSESMTNQFFADPLTVTEKDGKYTVSGTMKGAGGITMDMLEELKIRGADGSFAEVERTYDEAANTLDVTFEVDSIGEAAYFQVYVPKGMGEIRPVFRLVFDEATKQELQIPEPLIAAAPFADDAQISDWAKEAVYAIKAAGYISGKGENRYDPQGTATRAEAAKIFAYFEGYAE